MLWCPEHPAAGYRCLLSRSREQCAPGKLQGSGAPAAQQRHGQQGTLHDKWHDVRRCNSHSLDSLVAHSMMLCPLAKQGTNLKCQCCTVALSHVLMFAAEHCTQSKSDLTEINRSLSKASSAPLKVWAAGWSDKLKGISGAAAPASGLLSNGRAAILSLRASHCIWADWRRCVDSRICSSGSRRSHRWMSSAVAGCTASSGSRASAQSAAPTASAPCSHCSGQR